MSAARFSFCIFYFFASLRKIESPSLKLHRVGGLLHKNNFLKAKNIQTDKFQRGWTDGGPIREPSSFNLHHTICVKLGLYKVTEAPIRGGARMELYHSAGAEG